MNVQNQWLIWVLLFEVLFCAQSFGSPLTLSEDVSQLTNRLALESFQQSLLRAHPAFKIVGAAREQTISETEALLAGQDWHLSAGLQADFSEGQQLGSGYERHHAINSFAALSRKFWGNGSTLSVQWQQQSIRRGSLSNQSFFNGSARTHQQNIGVEYRLPLVSNRGGILDKSAHSFAEFNPLLTELDYAEANEGLLLQFTLDYLQWIYLENQIQVFQERKDLVRAQNKLIHKRFKNNLIDRVDWLRAQDNLKNVENNLLLLSAQKQGLKDKLLLAAELTISSDEQIEFDLYTLPALPDFQQLRDEAIPQSRPIALLSTQLKQVQSLKPVYSNEQKTTLDLIVGTVFKTPNRDSEQLDEFNKQEYTIGLELTRALGAREAKQKSRSLSAQIEQLKLLKLDSLKNLYIELELLQAQLIQLNSVIESNQKQLVLAENLIEAEWQLYQQGRNDLTSVLRSQESELLTRLVYLENCTTFQKLYQQLLALSDQLLPALSTNS